MSESGRRVRNGKYRSKGFSLVEMAVVLAIMAISLGLGLSLLRANQDRTAWNETKARQDRLKVALVSYLRVNGRLPCPNSVAPWDGVEDRPNANPGTPATTCTVNNGRGIVPWQTLGIGQSEAMDGWGNYFSYRVSNRTPATSSNWTINSGTGPFSIAELTVPLTALTLQRRDDLGVLGAALTPNPVVMIVSHGKNGLGARTIGGTLNTAPAGGTDELTNATAASTSFVDRQPTDVAGATGGMFDDQIAYLTPNDLLQALVDDKTLKSSQPEYYRAQAMQQVALTSCVPPLVAPSLAAIQPSVGNNAITYTCPVAATYSCRTATAVSNATAGTKQLYQLAVFNAAAQDVTYADLLAAYPAISTRCP